MRVDLRKWCVNLVPVTEGGEGSKESNTELQAACVWNLVNAYLHRAS